MLLKKRFVITGLVTALLVVTFLVSTNSSHPPLLSTDYVDSNQFTGEWYVISNIPYFAERNKVASKTTYMKVGEYKYQDIFEYREGSFDNKVEVNIGQARCLNSEHTLWQSTFLGGIIRFKFEILDVDPDYQVMLIGHRSRNYGWVMARDSKISDQEYQRAMETFSVNGYDIAKFSKVPQHPSDIGQAGYQIVSSD